MSGHLGRFVGVGVDIYDIKAHQNLKHAVKEVVGFHCLLAGGMDVALLMNPTKSVVQARLESLAEMSGGGSLVLMWSGHGVPSPVGGLRLLTRESGAGAMAGVSVAEVAGWCAESGAGQLLLILDTCFSGEGVPSVTEVATAVLASRPPEGRFVWVGVLASCLRWETARHGLFGQRLLSLVSGGPAAVELRRPWSAHNEFLSGHHICDALVREWDSDRQQPVFRSEGVPDWLLPNPLFDDGASAQVVEHLLLAARGRDAGEQRSWFTGRKGEVNTVVTWVFSGEPGVRVVTGSAGTGKSAIVGRLVSVSNPSERELLSAQGLLGHDDPGERSVAAHAHARGRTADQLAGLVDSQLVTARVLLSDDAGPRNSAQLVGALQKRAEAATYRR